MHGKHGKYQRIFKRITAFFLLIAILLGTVCSSWAEEIAESAEALLEEEIQSEITEAELDCEQQNITPEDSAFESETISEETACFPDEPEDSLMQTGTICTEDVPDASSEDALSDAIIIEETKEIIEEEPVAEIQSSSEEEVSEEPAQEDVSIEVTGEFTEEITEEEPAAEILSPSEDEVSEESAQEDMPAEVTEEIAEEVTGEVSEEESVAETLSPSEEEVSEESVQEDVSTEDIEEITEEITEENAEEEPAVQIASPSEEEVPQEALAEEGQETEHQITDLTLTQVNGYTTLHFTIDGRYETTLCGLSPDTTQEEALTIALGTAADLYGEGSDFEVSSGKSYGAYWDSYAVSLEDTKYYAGRYDELAQKYAEDPESVTEEELEDAAIYMLVSYRETVRYMNDDEAVALIEQMWFDPDDPQIRAQLDERLALYAEENDIFYQKTRTWEDVNTVFPDQTGLIDAEKTSLNNTYLEEDQQDSNLCWAASAANMLWYSGWGAQAINPETGEAFASEDELFHWFSASFNDEGGNPETAIQYLFKGINILDGTSHLYLNDDIEAAETPYALLKDYCADFLEEYIDASDNPDEVAQGLDALETGAAIGLGVYPENFIGGHALTAFGRIVDTQAATPAEALCGLFIADSDSDVPYLSETQFFGSLTEDGENDPTQRRNTYTFVKTSLKTNEYTQTEMLYLDYSGGYVLPSLTVLQPYTEESVEEALETDPDATLNARDTADLLGWGLSMAKDGGSVAIIANSFLQTDQLLITLDIENESATAVEKGVDIPVCFTIYRLDNETETETLVCEKVYSDGLDSYAYETVLWEMDTALQPGVYRVELTGLNDDHTIEEAYFINNIMTEGHTFTILAVQPAKKSSKRIWYVSAVCLNQTAPMDALLVAWEKEQFVNVTADFTGAVLYDAQNNRIDKNDWALSVDEEGVYSLILRPEILKNLEAGETKFRLECKDARIWLTVTVAAALEDEESN